MAKQARTKNHIRFRAYDHDLHRFMNANEVRIDPTGQVWYNNSTTGEIWEPLHPNAEWLTIEVITVTSDDYPDLKKRV